ncbi:GAF domain-containing protein [Thermoclostridium stercorarium]|uniref:GAF domain-containing protein n=1 Tax=Thermoclostridium stercorarium TaxID=1510 RepID=UPI000A75BA6E
MFEIKEINAGNKNELYRQINNYLTALISDDRDWLAGLANASALLYQTLPDINWAGFYLWKGNELVLGLFRENRHA